MSAGFCQRFRRYRPRIIGVSPHHQDLFVNGGPLRRRRPRGQLHHARLYKVPFPVRARWQDCGISAFVAVLCSSYATGWSGAPVFLTSFLATTLVRVRAPFVFTASACVWASCVCCVASRLPPSA